jgi:Cupin domain
MIMSSLDVETKLPFSLLGTLLVRADEGRTLFRGAHSIAILLDGKQTGEKFTTLLVTSPPGGGPGPHYHDREDEWFYIVQGRVSCGPVFKFNAALQEARRVVLSVGSPTGFLIRRCLRE